MDTLVFLTGIRQGERVPLKKPVVRLGRERHNDIRIEDEGSSRSHAEIARREGGLFIRDLGSTNGTYVNDQRIEEATLGDGDRIAIGDTILLYQIVEEKRAPGRRIAFSQDAEHVSARIRLSTQEIPGTTEKRAAEDFRRLSEFIWNIMPIVGLNRLCDVMLEHVLSTTNANRAAILLSDDEGVLNLQASRTKGDGDVPDIEVSRTVTGYVLQQGEALLAVDPASDTRFKDTTVIKRVSVTSVVAVPLRVRERIIGALYLDTVGLQSPLTEEDLRLLTAMALPFAVAVENTRLYQRLTESVELSQGILRSLVSGILVVDREGIIKQVNKAALEILHLRAKDLVDRNVHEIPNLSPMAHLLDRAVREGATVDQAELLISSGVDEIPVGVTTSLLAGITGEPNGVVASFRNLSEIKKLSERVQMTEHLAALGEMAAGIAHEVRNPLNSIRGFASLINERVIDSKLKEFSTIIIDEVDRMNTLVEDLLDFARHRELEMADTDIVAVIQSVLNEFSHQMDENAVGLKQDVQPVLPGVWGNADRLKQVFINIVKNAIEAMSEGGVLTVSAHLDAGGDEETVVIRISDSGDGIPQDLITKIFTPFFSRKQAGTGLGLAICQKIIKQHQGRIEVQSNAGEGTTFTIYLQPYQQGESGSRASGTGSSSHSED